MGTVTLSHVERKCYRDNLRLCAAANPVFNEPFSDTVESTEKTHHSLPQNTTDVAIPFWNTTRPI